MVYVYLLQYNMPTIAMGLVRASWDRFVNNISFVVGGDCNFISWYMVWEFERIVSRIVFYCNGWRYFYRFLLGFLMESYAILTDPMKSLVVCFLNMYIW